MKERPIRVVLADDHTMFRQGLAEMLSTDDEIEVVGEAGNGLEALDLVRKTQPDVLLLDVEMPVMGAQETLKQLFETTPAPKVVVVTMFDNPGLVRELLELGASAYLVKNASLQELISTVRAVARQPGEPGTVTIPRIAFEQGKKKACALSGREMEVLLLAARGLSNRQAAVALHLSEATVKRHLANIYAKLNVSSRSEATRKALSEGWISTHDVTHG